MSLWIAVGALTLIAVLPILWPLLRPGKPTGTRLEHDLEVFSDQLREVDLELSSDELTAEEAEETKREIERRILRAGERQGPVNAPTEPSALTAVLVALLLPALTLMLYVYLGRPSQPDQPLASRQTPSTPPTQALSGDQNEQMQGMVDGLAKRLRNQPDDLDGWRLLGRSLATMGRYDDAAKAFGRAIELSEKDAQLLVALGDVLMRGAGGKITPEALGAFTQARNLAPQSLSVQYYMGLADLQAGRFKSAFDAWLGLYRKLSPDSENRKALGAQIRQVAQQLGIDAEEHLVSSAQSMTPSARFSSQSVKRKGPGPDRAAIAEAAKMSPSDRQEFINSMVQRLADRLEDQPDDFDGWMRLGRAYGVLRKNTEAANAYGRAVDLRPMDPGPLDAQVAILIKSTTPDQPIPESTLAIMRKLEALQPDNRQALWFLGRADAAAGRRSKAIIRWERLHDLLPSKSQERARIKAAIDQLE